MNNEIKGYFQIGNIRKVNQIFSKIKNPDKFTYSIMIKGMSKLNNITRVTELFEESKKNIEPDVILYSSYVQILSKNENFSKIKEILQEMIQKNIRPNFVFFGFVLSGLSKKNKLKDSIYIFEYMKKNNYEINEYHISSILKIYANRTKHSMEEIFKFLEESNVKPNLIIHNNVILSFANRKLIDEGIKYLHSLEQVDEFSYNTLLVASCKMNRIELALELLNEMKERNLKVDQNSIVPIITYYKVNKMKNEVKAFIETQTKNSTNLVVMNSIVDTLVELEPDVFINYVEDSILKTNHYDNITIASISKMFLSQGKMDDFEKMIKKYNIQLTIDYYNTFISHCVSKRLFKTGIEIFKNLQLEPDVVTYNIMLNLYLEKGDIKNVINLWNQIESPNHRSYLILINGLFATYNDELAFQVYESMDLEPTEELKKIIEKKKQKLKK
eukprot:gene782-9032_t